MSQSLAEALRNAVTQSRSPGAVGYVGDRTSTHYHEAFGSRQIIPEVRPALRDTPYDLASLTKVVATTTAILLLQEEGLIELDEPVSTYVPIPAFGQFTIRHALTHTAGLVAGLPYYKDCSSLNQMLQRYAGLDLDWPPGTRRRYSDVGFMILGKVVELVARDSLAAFCSKRIFTPLQMKRTTFNPPTDWADTCAATEQCPWRGKVMVGAVHDENAYAVGGVAGHAGLFSTAEDLARFCRALVNGALLSEKTIAEMSRLGQVPTYPWQGLGWKLDPWWCANEGFLPARSAIGHAGWTGTSLWMDLESGLFVILLSNTCHPSRDHRNNETLRHGFHTAVAQTFYPNRSNTHTGLDRLVWSGFEAVHNKKIGLLTNHAAVDQLGRSILDVLALDPTIRVRAIYTPEHGFRGQAEAGEQVASENGTIPIISLYGERKTPSRRELSGVDLFVVDLQDVGSRYYTYIATMRDCLAACARAHIPVLVLDRPNPIGGEILEGPIATHATSPTCSARVPARHGMTLGELAMFFRKNLPETAKLKLAISELDAWPRRLFFTQCALPWVAPSPNIPDPETALLYVGMCLFEGTNLNEGRGTETPFRLVGAPWLDAASIAARISAELRPGCSLEAVTYTPKSIPGKARSPRYRDATCPGVHIMIEEPIGVRAFTLAVALLSAIRKQHPNEFAWNESFDVLAGTPDLRRDIERDVSTVEIIKRYAAALEAFDKDRPRRYEVLAQGG